jgi:hypothetical protein
VRYGYPVPTNLNIWNGEGTYRYARKRNLLPVPVHGVSRFEVGKRYSQFRVPTVPTRVSDPYLFDTDPDPAFSAE